MSELLQNTLELYLTPGSCPKQKYIGWNLQPGSNKPGGWRRKAALHHSPDSLPTPSILWASLSICTILSINAVSSCKVVFKILSFILSLGFAEEEEKEDDAPKTQSSLLHSFSFFFFFFFFSSVLICGLFKGQDNPLCGGAVWNSPENACDNGSRQPRQTGIRPALEGALLSLGVSVPIQVSPSPPCSLW